ncbi:MAG TPA: hypothetical protein P5080_03965 [Candidatus Paceibacterota bacterium]|nr:hypothetical protein [Candidatus Pacearchaeota archaeon]HRZ51163.1 hypothetical protein [Candidatus Paceibacterota bacterium]HSA36830.1 hypothetical protein [Candidatus Paceibacterota bacterium]
MTLKSVFIIIILFLSALIQASFLSRFSLIGGTWLRYANIVLLLVVLFGLFERRQKKASFAAAVFGGLVLDLYSETFFGLWISVLLAATLFTKIVIRKYVRIPTFW